MISAAVSVGSWKAEQCLTEGGRWSKLRAGQAVFLARIGFAACLCAGIQYFTPPLSLSVESGGASWSAANSGWGQTFSLGEAVIGKGSERDLSEVKLKKGEPIDRALRRLKKKVDRENTLKDVRTKRHYEKPSERRRRKLKVARFSAMLSARYADL